MQKNFRVFEHLPIRPVENPHFKSAVKTGMAPSVAPTNLIAEDEGLKIICNAPTPLLNSICWPLLTICETGRGPQSASELLHMGFLEAISPLSKDKTLAEIKVRPILVARVPVPLFFSDIRKGFETVSIGKGSSTNCQL